VASDYNSFTSIVAFNFSKSGDDSLMKLSHRLASRKHHSIRVTRKIRSAVLGHKVIKLQAIAVRAWVVLTEPGTNVELAVADERRHNVGCLHCAWSTAVLGEPSASAQTAQIPLDSGHRFAVTH
jgi:hypothetical protein